MTDNEEPSVSSSKGGDRELLERAAKAAGIVLFDGGPDVRVPDECQARVWTGKGGPTILFFSDSGDNPLCKRVRPSGNVEWNPLTDDGDALRLAVKLRLNIEWGKNGAQVVFNQGQTSFGFSWAKDETAALRTTIVRAAAAIWDAK